MKKVLTIVLVVLLLQLIFVVSVSYAAPPASGGTYHTVRYGETLFSIGRLYGVYPYYIAEVNGLRNPDCIYAGEVLYIPSSGGYYPGQGCQNSCSGYTHPCCNNYRYGYVYDYTRCYQGGCNYPGYQPPVAQPPIYRPPVPTPY